MALPEITNPTIAQLFEIIEENIANNVEGGIDPLDDRAVRRSIVNFLNNITAPALKTKVVTLGTFQLDRFFQLPTTILDGTTIISVSIFLVCKTANNGFEVGDIVTAPTPYPVDSGRTASQGIGIEFTASDVSNIKIAVNDQVTIMEKYDATPSAPANDLSITASQWSIRATIFYV